MDLVLDFALYRFSPWQRTHTSNGQITPLTLGGDVTKCHRPVTIAMRKYGPSELDKPFGATRPLGDFLERLTGENHSNGTNKLLLRELGHVFSVRVWQMFLSVGQVSIKSVSACGI